MKTDVKANDDANLKAGSRGKSNSELMKTIVPFFGLIFVIALFAILTGGKLVAWTNIQRVLLQMVLLMIGSLGVTFTISHGNLDFSLGGVIGAAAMFSALAGTVHPALTIPFAILAAIICQLCVVGGSILFDIPAFVVSLAMMFITRGLMMAATQTRQIVVPKAYLEWDEPYVYFIALAIVLVVLFFLFEYTKVGKYNRAIGSNYTAAVTSGVRVNKFKALAFVVSGAALGVSAFLNLIRAGGITATTGAGFETNVLIALVLGGVSLTGGTNVRLRGAVIGCLILTVLENGLVMIGVQPNMVGTIKGIVFLTSIAFAYDRKTGQIIT